MPGLFGRQQDGPVDVGTVPTAARPDTGLRREGPLLVAFDVQDGQEYAFPPARVAYLTDATAPLEMEEEAVEGAGTRLRLDDLDGYMDLYVSTPYTQALGLWREVLEGGAR